MEKLWVDKYRPHDLSDLSYHQDLTHLLQKLAAQENFPHLLFYGPSGAGKKTRIMSFLAQVYDKKVHNLQSELKEFQVGKSASSVAECNIISSPYHIDVTPSDAENHDKVVIQKLIKEVASTHQLDATSQKSFKVIIINEVDRLTKEAQAGLRRTMEKYVAKCRLILCCENMGRVIQPLRSRCLLIRVPSPSTPEMRTVLQHVAACEGFDLPSELCEQIIKDNSGNMRSALLTLQSVKMQHVHMTQNTKPTQAEWRKAIGAIARSICSRQSPDQLRTIRDNFYDLLVNCIPGDIVIKTLMYALIDEVNGGALKSLSEDNKSFVTEEVIHYAAHYENRMQLGQKPIFHIEAYAAQVMVTVKKGLTNQR